MNYEVLKTITINEGSPNVPASTIRVGYIIEKYSWGESFIKPCTWNEDGICSERGYDDIEPLPDPYFV